MAVANPPSHHMSTGRLPDGSVQIQRIASLAEFHCLPQAVFPGRLSVNASPDCPQQRHWEHLYPHGARRQQERQQQQQQQQEGQQDRQQKRPASLLWHRVAKKQCFAWNTRHNSLPAHLMAYWRAAADIAVATGAVASAATTAVNAADPVAPTAATPAAMYWMVSKGAAAAGTAGDSARRKDLRNPMMTPHIWHQQQHHHHHHHHHDKAPPVMKGCAGEEGTLLSTSATSTTSGASTASNGSPSSLNDEECVPWCSDEASQSPSSHLRVAESMAHEAGPRATWQPETSIQGLQHAAVFPFSFGPEAGTGETPPSMNTHTPFPQVPVSHLHETVPLPFNHPAVHAYHVPSFAGLLDSISPARRLHRRVASVPAASVVCSSCNHSVSPCLPVKEGLLPPEAHAQQQEQEQEKEKEQQHEWSGSGIACSASLSGKTCVLNSPSMGSRCSQQGKQERWERRVQGLVVTGDALAGLRDGQQQSAAGSGNCTVSGNRAEGSEDDEDLEELQDTASS